MTVILTDVVWVANGRGAMVVSAWSLGSHHHYD
jgi:hypothetical protein